MRDKGKNGEIQIQGSQICKPRWKTDCYDKDKIMPTQPYKVVPDETTDHRLRAILGINGVSKEIRVPGTTTIISRFKESGGLVHWAWDLGMHGTDYRSVRDAAADAGTLAHAMVEADIRGNNQPDMDSYPVDLVAKAQSSFSAYLEWKGQTKLKPFHTELPLVSRRYLFGGTIDAVQLDNKVALLDWKTSNGIYQDHLIQVGGGYSILWEENFPDQPITGGFHILRFSKVDGDLTHHTWQNLDMAKEAFINMRLLFEMDKKLKARL
jgi:hypothetical protein